MSYEPVSADKLAEVGRAILIDADMPRKSGIFHRIAEKQPDLAMVVAMLSEDGVDEEMHGHMLEMFIVLYMACCGNKENLPTIKPDDLEKAFHRVGDMHKYLEKESDKKMWDKVVESHPEPQLLGFLSGRLNELGIRGNTMPECKAILTMQGILEALTDARKKEC